MQNELDEEDAAKLIQRKFRTSAESRNKALVEKHEPEEMANACGRRLSVASASGKSKAKAKGIHRSPTATAKSKGHVKPKVESRGDGLRADRLHLKKETQNEPIDAEYAAKLIQRKFRASVESENKPLVEKEHPEEVATEAHRCSIDGSFDVGASIDCATQSMAPLRRRVETEPFDCGMQLMAPVKKAKAKGIRRSHTLRAKSKGLLSKSKSRLDGLRAEHQPEEVATEAHRCSIDVSIAVKASINCATQSMEPLRRRIETEPFDCCTQSTGPLPMGKRLSVASACGKSKAKAKGIHRSPTAGAKSKGQVKPKAESRGHGLLADRVQAETEMQNEPIDEEYAAKLIQRKFRASAESKNKTLGEPGTSYQGTHGESQPA
jgi:hypothetical protein